MARPALLLLLLALAGCLDGASRHVREGNRAAAAGHLEAARAAFARAVEARPHDVRARVLLGHALATLQRGPAARAEYAAALEHAKDCAAARVGLARLELLGAAPESALELLAPVPATEQTGLLKARALLARGRPGDGALALSALGAATSPEAAYLRGNALVLERRFAEAQATLAALEPTSPPLARYGMARVAAAQGRSTDVLMHLGAARVALGPRWQPAAVAADPAFDFVRDAPDFQPLISK